MTVQYLWCSSQGLCKSKSAIQVSSSKYQQFLFNHHIVLSKVFFRGMATIYQHKHSQDRTCLQWHITRHFHITKSTDMLCQYIIAFPQATVFLATTKLIIGTCTQTHPHSQKHAQTCMHPHMYTHMPSDAHNICTCLSRICAQETSHFDEIQIFTDSSQIPEACKQP